MKFLGEVHKGIMKILDLGVDLATLLSDLGILKFLIIVLITTLEALDLG